MCIFYNVFWCSQRARCFSAASFRFYQFTCNSALRVVSLIFSYISFCFVSFHSVHILRSFGSFNANFSSRKLFRQKCNNKTEAKYFKCVAWNIETCTTNKMTPTAHEMCVFVCLAKKDGKNLLFLAHIHIQHPS